MPLLVVGSVALDSVETPSQSRDDLLGGSAVYFSYAASYFTPVRLVGVVGDDWPAEHTEMLKPRNIDTAGPGGRARGQDVPLAGQVLRRHEPARDARGATERHGAVRPRAARGVSPLPVRVPGQRLDAAADASRSTSAPARSWPWPTRWTSGSTHEREELGELLRRIDGLVLNDSEAKLLTGEENLVRAGQRVREMGPSFVVIKKGEHGAMFFSEHETYVLPAYPTDRRRRSRPAPATALPAA